MSLSRWILGLRTTQSVVSGEFARSAKALFHRDKFPTGITGTISQEHRLFLRSSAGACESENGLFLVANHRSNEASSAGACESENGLSRVANQRSTDARSVGTILVDSVVENTESFVLAP